MYLKIQNLGEAAVEAYTLLGASGSRNNASANGQFGTGNKLGITLLLREGYNVKVYCGLKRLVFGTRRIEFEGQTIHRITVSVDGRKAVDCGWTLDWGCMDWTSTAMGLRELVANALDASIRRSAHDEADVTSNLAVELVGDKDVKAKAGYTRVFVSVGSGTDVEDFYNELPRRFLHFSDTPLDQAILPKANRSLDNDHKAMVYRMGVFVCQLEGDSLYDYNLGAMEITIDESRNSNEYSVRAAIARRLRRATADELAPIFRAIGAGRKVLETRLDPDYLLPSWETPTESQIAQWQRAWKDTFCNAVMTDTNKRSLEYVQQKGYRAQSVDSSQWRAMMARMGIKSDSEVLSPAELKGRVPVGASPDMYSAVTHVWSVVKSHELTLGKELPLVGGFREAEGSVPCDVYVENGTVFLREDLDNNQRSALQGIAEYVTGRDPLTPMYQAFLLDLAAAMMTEF